MTPWAGPVSHVMDNRNIDLVIPEMMTLSQEDRDRIHPVEEDASDVPPLSVEYIQNFI